MTHVKISMIFVVGLPLVFSAGYGVLNGRQSKKTRHPGVKGYVCSIDDSYIQTKWPMIHSGFFLLLFLSCCIPMVVLYALIGAKTWRHERSLMASSRFNISDKTGTIKINTSKVAETNSTSRDLDTGDLATSIITEGIEAFNFTSILPERDIGSSDTDGAEEQRQKALEEMRMLTLTKVRNESSTNCKHDRSGLVAGDNMISEHQKINTHKRRFHICEELQNISEAHKADIIYAEANKDELKNAEIHKAENTNSKRYKFEMTSSESHKADTPNAETHTADTTNAETHKSEINNSEIQNDEVVSLEGQERDNIISTVEDCMRERLNTFPHKEASSQPIRASTTIELLPTMLRPHPGHWTSRNSTISDDGISLLVETPSSSLQRNQNIKHDLRQQRKYKDSFRPKQFHTARVKCVHTSRSFDRTTRMLLAMSLVFIFTYLPFVCLELFKYAIPGGFASQSDASLSVYYLFWRSYLLNSCANPIIYCLYNLKFRRESFKLLFKLLSFKT